MCGLKTEPTSKIAGLLHLKCRLFMRLGPGDPMEVRGLPAVQGVPPFSFLSTNGMVDMTQRLSQKTIQLKKLTFGKDGCQKVQIYYDKKIILHIL